MPTEPISIFQCGESELCTDGKPHDHDGPGEVFTDGPCRFCSGTGKILDGSCGRCDGTGENITGESTTCSRCGSSAMRRSLWLGS